MGLAESGALNGKVAIITGAATGIGRASALLFARAGARVALADVREAELGRTVADVGVAGGQATAVPVDLARPEDCARLVAETIRIFGRLDVVVNNLVAYAVTTGEVINKSDGLWVSSAGACFLIK